MNFYEFSKEAHDVAKEKGFWELEDSIMKKLAGSDLTAEEIDAIRRAFYAQKLMLIASEVFEAFEELRKGGQIEPPRQDIDWFIRNYNHFTDAQYKTAYEDVVKGSVWEEQGDVIIRIGDLAGRHNVDLDFLIRAKMRYNKLRGKKHGKAF